MKELTNAMKSMLNLMAQMFTSTAPSLPMENVYQTPAYVAVPPIYRNYQISQAPWNVRQCHEMSRSIQHTAKIYQAISTKQAACRLIYPQHLVLNQTVHFSPTRTTVLRVGVGKIIMTIT